MGALSVDGRTSPSLCLFGWHSHWRKLVARPLDEFGWFDARPSLSENVHVAVCSAPPEFGMRFVRVAALGFAGNATNLVRVVGSERACRVSIRRVWKAPPASSARRRLLRLRF